jgi:hypothetical protein
MIFEVVLIETPTPKDEEAGVLEKLLFGPEPVVAVDPQSAGFAFALEKAGEIKELDVDKARIKVLIRPFGE